MSSRVPVASSQPALELRAVLAELNQALRLLYGPRLKQVILYGSWARGDATDDSDIDIAVVLEGDVSPTLEIDRTAGVVFDLNLKYGVLIAVYPVSESEYRDVVSPLLLNLRREGIPARARLNRCWRERIATSSPRGC